MHSARMPRGILALLVAASPVCFALLVEEFKPPKWIIFLRLRMRKAFSRRDIQGYPMDGLHPNQNGYAAMAPILQAAIEKVFTGGEPRGAKIRFYSC
jgi:lysophospholipase L1-like esterase